MLKINSHSLDVPPKELSTCVLRLEVQRVIEQYAKVFQCPKDFITSAVYCIVATLCGKHVTIHDGKYRNHPNLWISHIAPSGSNKSSPIKALLEPMHQEMVIAIGIFVINIRSSRRMSRRMNLYLIN